MERRNAAYAFALGNLASQFLLNIIGQSLTRAEMADYAVRARDLGVGYIGSCCGAVAEHVRAMANELGKGIGSDRRIGMSFLFPGVGLLVLSAWCLGVLIVAYALAMATYHRRIS